MKGLLMPKMTTKGLPETEDLGVPPEDDLPEDGALPLGPIIDIVNPNTLNGQFAMGLDQALFKMSEHAATILATIDKSWDTALRVLNHNNAATQALVAALQPVVPYSATISTRTPSGFPMSLTVQQSTQQGFFEAMDTLFVLLKEGGFTPGAA